MSPHELKYKELYMIAFISYLLCIWLGCLIKLIQMRNKRISKRAQSVDEYNSQTKTQKLPTILTPTFADWKLGERQEHPKISKRNPIYEKFYPPSPLRDLRSEGKENQKRYKSTGRNQDQDVLKYESADKIQDENIKPIYQNPNLNYRKRINIATPSYQSPVSKAGYFQYTEQDLEIEQLRSQLMKMEQDQRSEQEFLVCDMNYQLDCIAAEMLDNVGRTEKKSRKTVEDKQFVLSVLEGAER